MELLVQMGVPASSFCKKHHWKGTRTAFRRRWSFSLAQLTPPRLRWLVQAQLGKGRWKRSGWSRARASFRQSELL